MSFMDIQYSYTNMCVTYFIYFFSSILFQSSTLFRQTPVVLVAASSRHATSRATATVTSSAKNDSELSIQQSAQNTHTGAEFYAYTADENQHQYPYYDQMSYYNDQHYSSSFGRFG